MAQRAAERLERRGGVEADLKWIRMMVPRMPGSRHL